MPVTVEQATTELRRRKATEELARRRQADFGMIALPKEELPGVWGYDKQLDRLLGDPEIDIEDLIPANVKYDFGRITGMTEKPDETKDKMATSLFYSVELGIPPSITYDILDELNKIAFDETIPASTAWGRIKQRYRTGKASVQLMDLGYDMLKSTWQDWELYERNLKNIEKLQSSMTIDQRKEFRGFFEKLVGASAEVTPFFLEAAKEFPAGAAIGGTMFGIGAALTTAAIPTIGEEAIVPSAILAGAKIGAGVKGAVRVGELEAGGMFLELAQMKDQYGNKIDPKIAVVASHAVGAINGGIELAEWQVLLGTFGLGKKLFDKSVRKVTHRLFTQGTLKELIARKALDYSIALGAETLQEIEQETTTIVFGELAKELNDARKGTDFKPITAEDLRTRYREVTIESMRAFGLMVLPGTTISGALELVAQKKAVAVAKKVEKPAVVEVKAPPEIAALTDEELYEKFRQTKITEPEFKPLYEEVVRRKEAEAPPTEAVPAPEKPVAVRKPAEVAEVPPKAVEAKQPWEMTREEFVAAPPLLQYKGYSSKQIEDLTQKAYDATVPQAKKQGIKIGTTEYGNLVASNLYDEIIKDATKRGKTVPTPAKPKAVEVGDMTLDELKKESAIFDKKIETEIARLDKIAPERQIIAEPGISHLSQEDAARYTEVNYEIARREGISQAEAKKRVAAKRAARLAKPEVAKVEKVEPEKPKLRQKIHAIAAVKGLTKKAISDLKLKHTGYRKLTGKIANKKISLEQLQNLLKAVQRARPRRIGYKRVIAPKTEKKIQSLKENLIKKTQMTERHFDEILEIEVHGKEPKYVDAKNFITETEGKNILRRMLDTAEIVRLTESYEQAIAKNPEIADRVKLLDSRIEKAPKRDPYSLESMRYYNQQAEIKTGAPIYTSYMDLMDTHLEIVKTRTATWKRLERTTEKFKEIAKDEEALQRVSDYIASQSTLKEKPAMPKDITADEIKLAKEIQKILKEYQFKARVTKFYNWYYYNQPIPDHDRYRTQITKAVDIYESKGREELIEYLNTQEWGVIHSGYEPLEILFHKIRPYTTGPTAVGKGHIKIRTDIEYHRQERNILQRLSAYMRQVDMLYNLSPKINAYVRLYDDNASKFTNWGKVKNDVEIFLRNLKRYNIEGGFFQRVLSRAYSQAMRVIIMPSPVLSFRNLFQNAAFEHDKSILIDPRNTKLTNKDIEYLETYVLQTRAMVEEYFMVGEKPLPGLGFLTKLIDKVKIYPYSDIANRHWSFWAKTNQVDRALKAETIKQMMTEAKFEDMKELEQRRALAILARDGKEAMTQYIGRVHVDDIHFLYERAQRSPAEMTSLGKIVGNLMLFPRAYGEKLAHAVNKTLKGKTYQEQWRGLNTIFAVVGGGLIVGSIYMKVTGRKRNPYNPLETLAFRPGGLAWGSIEAVTEVYANILAAAKGDSRALAALTVAIPRAADMFIPFYDYTLRAIEVATDQKNIDRKALRQMRMMIDKDYKIRGGAYKVKRTALEKWQYFLSGPSAEKEAKKKRILKSGR